MEMDTKKITPSVYDINDLYENNAFTDDEKCSSEVLQDNEQRSSLKSKFHAVEGQNALLRHKQKIAAGGEVKQSIASQNIVVGIPSSDLKGRNNIFRTQQDKGSPGVKENDATVEFNVWVTRKDKYERIAQALGELNTERCNDDNQWFDVAVALAAVDCLLKTGKDDSLCSCIGICRDPSHSIRKQRIKCQCPARKCSICRRCINTDVGAISEKMIKQLAPLLIEVELSNEYDNNEQIDKDEIESKKPVSGKGMHKSQTDSQKLQALAIAIINMGEGKRLVPGGTKLTTNIIRAAESVMKQCSWLEDDDGVRLQRKCSCAVRSLGDLWLKWTTKYHTFSEVALTEEEAKQFDEGTRGMMWTDESNQSQFFMTLKWFQAAKAQAGDTAKIAARRRLTPDQKRQNRMFIKQCKKYWQIAQSRVVEQLETVVASKQHILKASRCYEAALAELEINVLNSLGVKRMLMWVEQDKEVIQKNKDEDLKTKHEEGLEAHKGWVRTKDRLRIRIPNAENRTHQTITSKPPRMDFSTGKSVPVRPKRRKMPSSTIEILASSGLKVVHALNDGIQGRGGDLMKCKQQLLAKGHVLNENFEAPGRNGNSYQDFGDNDDNDDMDPRARYKFEKENKTVLKKHNERARQLERDKTLRYKAWTKHKEMKKKALTFLSYIPKPNLNDNQSEDKTKSAMANFINNKITKKQNNEIVTDPYNDGYFEDSMGDEFKENNTPEDSNFSNAPLIVRWGEVGKALKAIDRGLLQEWVKWSEGFQKPATCRIAWDSYDPKSCDVHSTSSPIRSIFLKLLHRKDIDYKQAFVDFCERKHKKLLLLDDDPSICDDMTEEEKLEKFDTLSLREFQKLLKEELAIVLLPEEAARIMDIFDINGDGLISMREFMSVVGEKRGVSCMGDTDRLLENVCMWETICHECGMLNAFQLGSGGSKNPSSRFRSELPDHVKRRKRMEWLANKAANQNSNSSNFLGIICTPECRINKLKTIVPKRCSYVAWTDDNRANSLKKLEIWSAQQIEIQTIQKIVTEGSPPDAPALYRDNSIDSSIDPTTEIYLRWDVTSCCPPEITNVSAASFYILETIGAEGTQSFRVNEFTEIYRDPNHVNDNNGQPRFGFTVHGLQPNTKYGFRVRAFNVFGASPYTFSYFFTAPATPTAPLGARISANSIYLVWNSSMYYRQQLHDLRQVFDEIDADGNGYISRDELMKELELKKPRLVTFLKQTPLSMADENFNKSSNYSSRPLTLFDAIETDDNEKIEWDEFLKYFQPFLNDEIDNMENSSGPLTNRNRDGKRLWLSTSSATQCKYILKQCTQESTGEYVEIYQGTKCEFTISGLASGSSYQFRVQAFNDGGIYSMHSDSTVITTMLRTPSAPIVEFLSHGYTSMTKLKWSKAEARPFLAKESLHSQPKAARQSSITRNSNEEVIHGILKEWTQSTCIEEGTIDFHAKFKQYDVDDSGKIELNELKTLLSELGAPPTADRMQLFLSEFDTNHDGAIDFNEFKACWTKPEVHYILKRSTGLTESDTANSKIEEAMSVVCYKGSETSAVINDLVPNTRYIFRLRLLSSKASSKLSEAVEVWTAPEPPTCAGIISTTISSAYIRWYPSSSGASRYQVEIKFIESLDASTKLNEDDEQKISGNSNFSDTSIHDWAIVYDGNETITNIVNLLPDSVYRIRIFAWNKGNIKSEQSTVSQFCTLSKSEEKSRCLRFLKPSMAGEVFTVECECTGDIVLGDTILFSERLYQNDRNGNIRSDFKFTSNSNSSPIAIGERTIAARVVGYLAKQIVRLEVVWCTVHLYDNSLPAVLKYSARGSKRIAGTFGANIPKGSSPLPPSINLPTGAKISRKEEIIYRYATYRILWINEYARNSRTWKK